MPTPSQAPSPNTQATTAARAANLADELIVRIRRAIYQGVYVPGQRLVEADLIEHFKTSRGPAREALRRLSAEGIVQLVPNRGAMVRRLGIKEMDDLFRIREALEGLAARLAAERLADPKVRPRFEKALKAIDVGTLDELPEAFGERNRRFHQLIFDFADNEQLLRSLQQMQLPLMRLQVRASIDRSFREHSVREHEDVARALLAADPDRAELAMRAHLRGARQRVVALAEREKQQTDV